MCNFFKNELNVKNYQECDKIVGKRDKIVQNPLKIVQNFL